MSKSILDRVSIGTSCQTDWEAMDGDDNKRYCEQCEKHVYNLSQMSRVQAEALIASTNGKLCARFERRPDGSIVTTEKSFLLPRFNQKFLRLASATVSAALSLSPTVSAKPIKNLPVLNFVQDKKEKSETQEKEKIAKIYGTVFDEAKAVIVNATITLFNKESKQSWEIKSSSDGRFEFAGLNTGEYSLTFFSVGFKNLTQNGIGINAGDESRMDVVMEVAVSMGDIVTIPDAKVAEASFEGLNLEIENRSPSSEKKKGKSLLNKFLESLREIK